MVSTTASVPSAISTEYIAEVTLDAATRAVSTGRYAAIARNPTSLHSDEVVTQPNPGQPCLLDLRLHGTPSASQLDALMVAHDRRIGLPCVGNTGRMVASVPSTNIPVPAAVLMATCGRRVRPVWENELGGITFEVGTDPER